MKARFDLQGLHQPIVVLSPDDNTEAVLLAAFLRYDSNVFHVGVDRYENGRIQYVRLIASEAS